MQNNWHISRSTIQNHASRTEATATRVAVSCDYFVERKRDTLLRVKSSSCIIEDLHCTSPCIMLRTLVELGVLNVRMTPIICTIISYLSYITHGSFQGRHLGEWLY